MSEADKRALEFAERIIAKIADQHKKREQAENKPKEESKKQK